MEWTESIRRVIDYAEEHLTEEISIADIARDVSISPFYLQKGFKLMTGYSLGEYIRNRRLYQAALEIIAGKEKMIDLALKYGYDTPESFTKAFARFHGVSPSQLKKGSGKIQVFLPLKIHIEIRGGNEMEYTIEKMASFRVIGFERRFNNDSSYLEIPKFWSEMMGKSAPITEKQGKIAWQCRIGEYGVCIDDIPGGKEFRYLIAGKFGGGEIPEGMVTYTFPEMEWAKFPCRGPMPGALQSVNTRIFKEWLPGNPDWEIAMPANIEWYACGDTDAADYQSAIWIPVKKK